MLVSRVCDPRPLLFISFEDVSVSYLSSDNPFSSAPIFSPITSSRLRRERKRASLGKGIGDGLCEREALLLSYMQLHVL